VACAGPALVVALRGLRAFHVLESTLGPSQSSVKSQPSLDRVMSPTPELAFRLLSVFFADCELFADADARPLLPYLPPVPVMSKTASDQVTVAVSQPRQ